MPDKQWKIRLRDVDTHEVIFYPALFLKLQHLVEEYFDEAGYSFHQGMPEAGINVPVVRAEADYEKPIIWGDVISLGTELEFSDSSITFKIIGKKRGERMFKAKQVHVLVDDDFQTMTIPTELKSGLRKAID